MSCRSALYFAAIMLFAMHSGKCHGQRAFPEKAPQAVAFGLQQAFESVKQLLGVEGAVVLQIAPAAEVVSAPAGTLELQMNLTKLADVERYVPVIRLQIACMRSVHVETTHPRLFGSWLR